METSATGETLLVFSQDGNFKFRADYVVNASQHHRVLNLVSAHVHASRNNHQKRMSEKWFNKKIKHLIAGTLTERGGLLEITFYFVKFL